MSDAPKKAKVHTGPPPLHGLLAEYETPAALIKGAEKVRNAGFRDWDTFTPFPVHGIDGAMGIKPTILTWLILGGGMTGCTVALGFQWWANGVDYPFLVSALKRTVSSNVIGMFAATLQNGLPLMRNG